MNKQEDILLVPYPKNLSFRKGSFFLERGSYLSISLPDKDKLYPVVKKLQGEVKDLTKVYLEIMIGQYGSSRRAIIFEKDCKLDNQGYKLFITPENIVINYKDIVGAFYATRTLKQLIEQCSKSLPCLEIDDKPDFLARGIMLDISRGKIPTKTTLFKIIDLMADSKLNQLQLYIEGFSFAYPSFPQVWEDGTPLTGEDIMEIDKYCHKYFIELVPNQNSFGHMAPWLAREEFHHLAECPAGFELWGGTQSASTLDAQDPGSIELLEKMYDDFLPYFSSNLFNVGCDETFELGKGKNEELCKEKGVGTVYLEFLLKIYQLVKKRGKKMMLWGDIIRNYPSELIAKFPSDVIALDWGYSADDPFEEWEKKFKESGLSFYVCPGTSSWNSIAGKTDNMLGNIINAAKNGKKSGAIGFLNTDWGDNGHWQYLPVSYPGFLYGAALSWGVEENEDIDLAACLDRFIFKDKNNIMGQFVLNLGNYYLKEEKPMGNITNIFRILNSNLENISSIEGLREESLLNIKNYVDELLKKLIKSEMKCEDAELIEAEFKNSIRFIKHGVDLGILKFKIKNELKDENVKKLLKNMIKDIVVLTNNHKKLWLERNRLSDLTKSVARLEKLKGQYQDYYENNF